MFFFFQKTNEWNNNNFSLLCCPFKNQVFGEWWMVMVAIINIYKNNTLSTFEIYIDSCGEEKNARILWLEKFFKKLYPCLKQFFSSSGIRNGFGKSDDFLQEAMPSKTAAACSGLQKKKNTACLCASFLFRRRERATAILSVMCVGYFWGRINLRLL